MPYNVTTENAKQLSVEQLRERLKAGQEGLSEQEAQVRLEAFGPNTIEERRVSPVVKFLSHFWGPIAWMIEAAAVLSAIVDHWADLTIILVLLLFNAGVGFWQEYKADNAIELLKKKLAMDAHVLREGSWKKVKADVLVPGDHVRVKLGDVTPADIKLTDGDYIQADESALTGESIPAEKHVGDVVYSGSMVQKGEMEGLVVATGAETYFGQTAKLVEETETRSHYQQEVMKIGHFLILVTIALIAIILLAALFRDEPMIETFQFALILTVAAIPVALPAVMSVTMAVGAIKLSREKAIVSHLVSIEELAGMDVLCSDKTGTLTKNKLKLGDPKTFGDATAGETIRAAALASKRDEDDPIDDAIFAALKEAGEEDLPNVASFTPFDPVSKRAEATVREGSKEYKTTKGAPQVVLDLCTDADNLRDTVSQAVDEFAGRGYRTLGVARSDGDGKWRMAGLLPLFDPPREDSAETLDRAAKMGVMAKMVTGDHQAIAKETARRLGMGTNILTADALAEGNAGLPERIEAADGFSQVFPEHKHRIVGALQERGHFVGMTGDGVNDAPALKKADIGIAVSGATEAARSAADLVLTEPGLSVIVRAIEEARRIFERMTSYATYRIAETLRVLLFMTASILIFNFYPVTAVMIILLALLNDLPIMMIAYDNARVAGGSLRWDMNKVATIASTLGVVGVIETFLLFLIAERYFHLGRDVIQTLIFLKLSVAGHMTIYVARTGDRPFWSRPLPSWLLVVVSEGTQILATLVAVFGLFMTPLPWKLALFVWGYAIVWVFIEDRAKIYAYRLRGVWGKREQAQVRQHGSRLHPAHHHG